MEIQITRPIGAAPQTASSVFYCGTASSNASNSKRVGQGISLSNFLPWRSDIVDLGLGRSVLALSGALNGADFQALEDMTRWEFLKSVRSVEGTLEFLFLEGELRFLGFWWEGVDGGWREVRPALLFGVAEMRILGIRIFCVCLKGGVWPKLGRCVVLPRRWSCAAALINRVSNFNFELFLMWRSGILFERLPWGDCCRCDVDARPMRKEMMMLFVRWLFVESFSCS